MNVTEKFDKIGARAVVHNGNAAIRQRLTRGMNVGGIRLNVLKDDDGEYFDVAVNGDTEVSVLDVQPKDRHLLLMAKQGGEKSKFLCGHDERHWFVAAIPEAAPVGTVRQAKEALKPAEIQTRQVGLNKDKRNKRKNSAYIRQGEWFFIPANITADDNLILKNEPITRGNGSKPHMAEFCYRTGGTSVWVHREYPNGVDDKTYKKLIKDGKSAIGWRVMQRDASVYVKGTIRHDDHKTINLVGWHRVIMNTEQKARAMRNVAFLD
jgi:hypothetical protein